jgi:hypothetical protein
MMGQRSGKQDRLFYTFNLDEHVPATATPNRTVKASAAPIPRLAKVCVVIPRLLMNGA